MKRQFAPPEREGDRSPEASPPDPRGPNPMLWLTDLPRALAEYAAFVACYPLFGRLPHGDGHGVMVLPGFLATDDATLPIRFVLKRLGYQATGWDLGTNLLFDESRFEALARCVRRLYHRTERKVSIVGWSLGGVLAREIARQHPEMVRQVISLGTPLSGDPRHAAATRLFETLNPGVAMFRGAGRFAALTRPPPVPSTCIYARGDGVVAWRGALQNEGAEAENVAVHASHCGLGANPLVMMVLADRLAQAEGGWRPFAPQGWRAALFPRPAA